MRRLGAYLAIALMAACRPIPPPDVLSRLDEVREAEATRRAKGLAPTAFAKAEKLRAEAKILFDEGDTAGSQIVGERALAAYAEAVALARAARAEKQRVELAADASRAEARLAELETEHQKIAADIAALEKRLRVLDEVEPLSGSGPADPDRERARFESVRSLQLQARLLCGAAELLAKSGAPADGVREELRAARSALDAVTELLAKEPTAAPIDHAIRARSRCLEALTKVRRAADDKTSAAGSGDGLLTALSAAGIGAPRRDERGVVVTLRDVFDGETVAKAGREAIAALAKALDAHKSLPIMVVLHQDRALDAAARRRWQARGKALVGALEAELGRELPPAEIAENAHPVVDPRGRHKKRNERVELVFVTATPM